MNDRDQDENQFSTPISSPYAASAEPPAKPVEAPGGKSPNGKSPIPPQKTTAEGVVISFICWMVIGGLVALLISGNQQSDSDRETVEATPEADLSTSLIQGKVLLGIKSLSEEFKLDQFEEGIPNLQKIVETGSFRNRLAGTVLLAEVESPENADASLVRLQELAKKVSYPIKQKEQRVFDLLSQIYQGQLKQLNDADRELLKRELLWFGELVLNPKNEEAPSESRKEIINSAKEKAYFLSSAMFLGGILFLVGLVGFIYMVSSAVSEKLEIRTENYSLQKTIPLEAFTIWIIAFLLAGVSTQFLPFSNALVANIYVFAASFTCSLFWLHFRSSSFRQSASDVGLKGELITEAFWGCWAYVCSLPIIAIGFAITLTLQSQFGSGESTESLVSTQPSHPILEWLVSGDLMAIVLTYIVACICAPVVEETVFRGYLYRFLRDSSMVLGRAGSVLVSALINGLIFAAIHPQGILFIPVLCSLAVAFSLAREWRGSLLGPMVMHAIHNGILTSILVFTFSS